MLEVRNLSVKYKNNRDSKEAVKDVSLSLKNGSFTGLVGESGSGKSTIIMAILALLPVGTEVNGRIEFDGNDVLMMPDHELRRFRWSKIALVPQGALNSFTPVLTIGRHIEEVLNVHLHLKGAEADKKVKRLLDEVGLDSNVNGRYPHELSGGQKQRAAIALALACSPSLLLADEPTTALDVIVQSCVLKLLAQLRAEYGLTVLLVTHDLPIAAAISDTLLVMKDGCIVENGSPNEIIVNPKHSHTKELVKAML